MTNKSFILFLFSIIFNFLNAEEKLVYFSQQIRWRDDALRFSRDPNANIARVAVHQMDLGDPKYFHVVIQKYLLEEALRDTGNKLLEVMFYKEPRGGWRVFYEAMKEMARRIFIQIPVAQGPGLANSELVYNFNGTLPSGFTTIIMAHAEEEDFYLKYNPSQALEMEIAFKLRVASERQWLRLNGHHVKNMKTTGKAIFRDHYENLRDILIIYQNWTAPGKLKRSEVMAKLEGFDPKLIIWENIPPDNEGEENSTSTSPSVLIGKENGNYFWKFVFFVILMLLVLSPGDCN